MKSIDAVYDPFEPDLITLGPVSDFCEIFLMELTYEQRKAWLKKRNPRLWNIKPIFLIRAAGSIGARAVMMELERMEAELDPIQKPAVPVANVAHAAKPPSR